MQRARQMQGVNRCRRHLNIRQLPIPPLLDQQSQRCYATLRHARGVQGLQVVKKNSATQLKPAPASAPRHRLVMQLLLFDCLTVDDCCSPTVHRTAPPIMAIAAARCSMPIRRSSVLLLARSTSAKMDIPVEVWPPSAIGFSRPLMATPLSSTPRYPNTAQSSSAFA